MTTRIGITGAAGRMGRTLTEAISLSGGELELAAAIEQPQSMFIGADSGELSGLGHNGVPVVAALAEVIDKIDVLIDFTVPAATVANAAACAQGNVAMVIGTTGFTPEQQAEIDNAAGHVAICKASNFSTGVNLCFQLLDMAARVLGDDVDIEVYEAHHRHKVDAPSGTALMLGEAAAEGRGVKLSDVSDRGRDGITGARKRGDIGFTAIRGGDIIGEHDVMFAAAGERIILRHVASDRSVFARGALKAALWGQGRAPGAYDMLDVLGLSTAE